MSTKPVTVPLPRTAEIEARMRGGALFVDQLEALFDAVRAGRHVADADQVMTGLATLSVSFAKTVTELEGYEREGFLLAWNWWTAVTVEGDVMSPEFLRAELERGVQ